MRGIVYVAVSMVVATSLGCSPSAATPPPQGVNGGAHPPSWLTVATSRGSSGLTSSAVIDGFRVHPDPGDDGVFHVFDDEDVVVNATDIASRPPADPNFLVVNWGDGPNQRVGCGPCRLDHGYGPGSYTLVASLDGGAGRSISVRVQVSHRGTKRPHANGPVQPFELSDGEIAVGDTLYLLLPPVPPPTLMTFSLPPPDCSPPGAANFNFAVPPLMTPDFFGFPFIGLSPGTCTVTLSGTLVGGAPFSQSVTFTIH